jgi:hypothetical protein
MQPAQSGSVEVRVRSLFARTPRRTILPIIRQPAARIAVCPAAACLIIFSCCLLLAGCGAPGQPTPPSPPIPSAITDLTARQSGDGALLTFTLPGKTVTGKRLTENPGCEIFRGVLKADGSADAQSFRLVYAIPSAMVPNYVVEKRVEFTDPLPPEESKAHPGGKVAYLVRTRVSPKKTSADSNIVEIAVFPVPQRIANVDAHVTETAIELSWPPVTQTSGGAALSDVSYLLFRGQLNRPVDQAVIDAAMKDLAHARWKSPLALLASPASNSYRDADFVFDETYVYIVRTVATARPEILESADSVPLIVTPKDIFPPAAPQGLVAAVLQGDPAAAPVVDLSWSISPESDVAGYRVYRSEQEGQRGAAVASELPTPAYHDAAVQPGHRYWYTVTAVDRFGNESPASAAVLAEIAAPQS